MQQVITFQSLYNAYCECRRFKRHTANTQRYEMALLDNLFKSLDSLQNRSYSPTRSIRFVAQKPKAREIHAADFSDRVIHHWLVPRLDKLFEPVFIYDLYSNRKQKGTHKAVNRLQSMMQSLQSKTTGAQNSKNNKGNISETSRLGRGTKPSKTKLGKALKPTCTYTGWYLQLDIANFFNTIDKPVLFSLLQHRLRKALKQEKITAQEAETYRWLCHVLLKNDTVSKAQYRGNPALLNRIPVYKQLGSAGENKGIPIGNLTSQFFANVYLNPLDQMIKHTLKCRYYLRYVDDFILLADSPDTLLEWRSNIQQFLRHELKLNLKEVADPQPIKSGVNFLGYISYPHYRLVRRRVVGSLFEKLRHFQRQLVKGALERGYILSLKPSVVKKLRATLASYGGHFSHAHSYRLRQRVTTQFPWLMVLFEVRSLLDSGEALPALQPCWEPKASQIAGYKSQIGFFQKHYPLAALAVQRGTQQDKFPPHSKGSQKPRFVGRIRNATRQAAEFTNILYFHPLPSPPPARWWELKVPFCDTLYYGSGASAPPAGLINNSISKTQNKRKQADLKPFVARLFIREQGYYKGGLKRRHIYQIHMQPGIELCLS